MKAKALALKEPQLVVSISDPSLVNKLKSAIQMLNGVSSISVLNLRKQNWNLQKRMLLKVELHNGTLLMKCLTRFLVSDV